MALASPLVHPGGVDLPSLGERMLVGWPATTAWMQLPVALTAILDGRVRTWTTRVDGPPSRLQRRAFVRAPEARPVAFGRIDGCLFPATMVDLSEGGLRATFTSEVDLTIGDEVEVDFDLDGWSLTAPAIVVRAGGRRPGPSPSAPALCEAGLAFASLSSADADRIRHHVFAKQARMRALGQA